jgi:phosphomannomutase
VFITDERGEIVDGSMFGALVARALLRKTPGATIVCNTIVSQCVPELVERLGGRVVRAPVGHAVMNAAMRAHDAIFGCEHSGHCYFRDFYDADSGLIALMNAIEAVAEGGKPVSQLLAGLCTRVRSGEINRPAQDLPQTLERVKRAFADGHIDTSDGVTVTYPQWWFNVRPSNTEPLLRVNVEADNAALLEQGRDRVLQAVGPSTMPR